jgi:hypothetical protein
MNTVTKTETAIERSVVDALLDRYVAWRQESAAVQQAYERWAESDSDERKLAHAGYVAALDREAQSARVYADQTDWVSRIVS